MDIKSIIKLANLEIEERQLSYFNKQVQEVIDYNIDKLKRVDLKDTPPVFQPSGLKNLLAEDEPRLSLPNKEVLKNAKGVEKGFFKIKAVFE